jgi:hypothetical protein
MLAAVTTSLAYKINQWCGRATIAIVVGFFPIYLASFLVQRDNYIAAVRVQSDILADLAVKLELPLRLDHVEVSPLPLQEPDTSICLQKAVFCIIGNVPEFLQANFNDETIFSDEVYDWNYALSLHTRGRLAGATVTPKKFCGGSKRVVLKGDSIIIDSITMPIGNAWYYEYSQRERSSILLRIRDEGHLREVLQSRIDCSNRIAP